MEGHFLETEKKYSFLAYGPSSPPLRFADLAGEIAHHLRSTLDHLVWALASKRQEPSSRIQFPISESIEKFELALRNGILEGVGRRAAKKIRAMQPFNHPKPREAGLYVLHQLDIVDKHRLPLVVTNFVKIGQSLEVGSHLGDLVINGISPPPNLAECSDKGTEIFWISFDRVQPDLVVKMDFQVRLAVRVRSSFVVELVPSFDLLQRFITDAVARFQEEF